MVLETPNWEELKDVECGQKQKESKDLFELTVSGYIQAIIADKSL